MFRMYRYIYQYKEKGSMPPFLKVIDQLVTPTPKMILLWWLTKGYPMKTHEF